MPVCVTCGNDYDKAFRLIMADGESYVFDSFECAIQRVAIECGHCKCRIIGHGLEAYGAYYCCASCAKHAGPTELRDRVE